jgi:hypothetical protein
MGLEPTTKLDGAEISISAPPSFVVKFLAENQKASFPLNY